MVSNRCPSLVDGKSGIGKIGDKVIGPPINAIFEVGTPSLEHKELSMFRHERMYIALIT